MNKKISELLLKKANVPNVNGVVSISAVDLIFNKKKNKIDE